MVDYRRWANNDTLDSVTNYECYKGLFSSFNDRNLHEIGSSLSRQFGDYGLYRDFAMYNFVDNHDVDRVASTLNNKSHLYPLYAILMTMPGAPSVYYGSQWGIEGKKNNGNDDPLRPDFQFITSNDNQKHKDLAQAISRLAKIRKDSHALKYGRFQQVGVAAEQLAFLRQSDQESLIVAINASDHPAQMPIYNLNFSGNQLVDILNPGYITNITHARAILNDMPPNWLRILKVQ